MKIFNELEKLLFASPKKILLFTLGNELRNDDGIALYIAKKLKILPPNIYLINGEERPENFIDEIIELHPELILIIDAADFGGNAGEIKLLDESTLAQNRLSTHDIPLSVIIKIIDVEIHCPIYYLGIQVINIDYGTLLSKKVKISADILIDFLQNPLSINQKS